MGLLLLCCYLLDSELDLSSVTSYMYIQTIMIREIKLQRTALALTLPAILPKKNCTHDCLYMDVLATEQVMVTFQGKALYSGHPVKNSALFN